MREEDYDRAKVLKQEIAVLRRNMDMRIRPVLSLSTSNGTDAFAPPLPPPTHSAVQQPPSPHQEQHQQSRGFSPSSYAPTPYDEIPVGGSGSAARAALYAAASSSSHSQQNADAALLPSPTASLATAAGGMEGGGGAAGGSVASLSPGKAAVPFDEDAPIVGAWRACVRRMSAGPGVVDTGFFLYISHLIIPISN